MKKVSVPNAERLVREIAQFIESDNPEAARRYVVTVAATFRDLPDNLLPMRASENLPKDVRKIPVPGFAATRSGCCIAVNTLPWSRHSDLASTR